MLLYKKCKLNEMAAFPCGRVVLHSAKYNQNKKAA